jgi:hypothetical protein
MATKFSINRLDAKTKTTARPAGRDGILTLIQSISTVVTRREVIIEAIHNDLVRMKESVINTSNPTRSREDKAGVQREIDALINHISSLCAGLPQLAEGDASSDQPGPMDPESLAFLRKKLDLGYLGLDKGIDVTREYNDLTWPVRQSLASELEASSNHEQRVEASSRMVAFDAAARKFQPAMERYVARSLETNEAPIPALISSADQLADELGRAVPDQRTDGLNASNLLLLAGGQENFADFLERLREVPSCALNSHLVDMALEKVLEDGSKLGEVRRKISAMGQTPMSGQPLASAPGPSSADTISDIVNQQPESILLEAALDRLSRDNKEISKLIR